MAEKIRVRGSKSFNTIEGITDSLRDYTSQVEDLTRQIERNRTRSILVGYLLLSVVIIVLLVATYASARPGGTDWSVSVLTAAFLAISGLGLPLMVYLDLSRSRRIRFDLSLAMDRLAELLRHASQIKEHVELERLDDVLLQFRLSDADATLRRASYALRPFTTKK